MGGGKGKIYLKLDLGLYSKNGKDLLIWDNMPYYLKIFHLLFKPLPDIYTVETQTNYNRLKNTYYKNLINENKLYLMSNGVDPELLEELGICRKKVSEKEKIIITVSVIGSRTYQKNMDLLFDILSDIDLKEWKWYIIGGISPDYKIKIAEFYQNNPEKRNSVIFTDWISEYDKYDLYNRSRVFLFTSRHESYGFVLAEAVYMRNYVISTNVGIIGELQSLAPMYLSDNQKKSELISELQRVISMSNDELNGLVPNNDLNEITWGYIVNNSLAMQKLAKNK